MKEAVRTWAVKKSRKKEDRIKKIEEIEVTKTAIDRHKN